MAASTELTFVLSLTLTIVIIAGMQIYKVFLSSSRIATIFAGYMGSVVFILVLTAISNLEMSIFGKHFQSKLTEVVLSLLVSLFVSGFVHRVSITVCFIFSMIALYYLNRISAHVHQTNVTPSTVNNPVVSKKRK